MSEVVAAGVALGTVYALLGVAVGVVALATRTLHLAVGQIVVLGALAAGLLRVEAVTGLPGPVAVLLAVGLGALVSAALEPAVLRPLEPGLPWLVGLVVAAAVIEAATLRLLGAGTHRPEPLLALGPVGPLPAGVVTAVAVGLPLALALSAAAARTRAGRRARLVGSAPEAAERSGVDPARTRAGALAVGGAVAVVAGLLAGPVAFVSTGQAAGFTVRGVAAALLFGRGGPAAALPGGILLGLVEAGAQAAWPQAGGDVAVAAAVVVILTWRRPVSERAWGRAW